MRNNIMLNGIVTGGKIDYSKINDFKLQEFLKTIPENGKLEIFISTSSEDGTLAQLAKIHAMCKELSSELGHNVNEIKTEAKRLAGLCIDTKDTNYCKSLSNCDKMELSLVIQALIEIGDYSGSNLR